MPRFFQRPLRQRGHAMKHIPRKRFGQHFLSDEAVIDAIVRAIAPCPGQAVVKYIPALFVIFWLFMSYYSYNPYTDSVITQGYSSVKLSLAEIEELYILSFDDGSSTTLIKKDGKWECTGAYENKHSCKVIVWVLSGQNTAFKKLVE